MTALKWFWMLSKRLYKKGAFVALLVLIPVCVAILIFAANQQSGFVTVALAQEDSGDALSSGLVQGFLEEKSLILFVQTDSREAAVAAVKEGQADAAWIFPADMQEKILDYAAEDSSREPVVSIVEREQTVFTRLSREKLTAALFQHCSEARYISFLKSCVPEPGAVSEEALLECYDGISISRELFAFDNEDANGDSAGETNYLTAPVRGLLAVLLCLGGAAAAVLHMQDEQKGVFALVKERWRPMVAFACVMIALLNVAAVILAALFATGLAGSVWRELAGMALYCVCCALFCLLLREIFAGIRLYCVMLPLLVIGMCAICPVFFDLKNLGFLPYVFPPTYYVYLLHDSRYLGYMLLYAGVLAALLGLLRLVSGIFRHR